MIISMIVARSENGVIGKDNQLPWHLPADLKQFKAITMGHTIIMGRKTFESIGKALPGRRSIVVSRNPEFKAEGAEVVNSLGEGLKACRGEDEVFIIGGASLYQKAFELNIIQRVYLTVIFADFEGDTFFEIPDENKWRKISSQSFQPDEKNAWPFTFYVLER